MRPIRALADFYRRLLGWTLVRSDSDWVMLNPPYGGAGLSFQRSRCTPDPSGPQQPANRR